MRKPLVHVPLLIALVLALASAPALAHSGLPAGIYDLQVGPYTVEVDRMTPVVRAGQPVEFMLLSRESAVRWRATLVPAPGLSATPLQGAVAPDTVVAGAVDVAFTQVTLGGEWTLLLQADGPRGAGEAHLPLTAVPPPAVPEWAGWLVGLSPLYGLVWFALRERRRLAQAG